MDSVPTDADARHGDVMRLVWLILAASGRLFADGGMVVLHQEHSPFVITVFASPTPPSAGEIDLSVLVQTADTLEPVLDANVQFELVEGMSRIQVRATREQAQDKLLYAASVLVNDAGEWQYTVSVRSARSGPAPIKVSGVMVVEARKPKLVTYWAYLAFPFLCLTVFALHQRLRFGKRLAPLETLPKRRYKVVDHASITNDRFSADDKIKLPKWAK
jgi:hypothetical protein